MVSCPSCGDEFEILPQHWRQSSACDWPAFTQEQKELLKGLVMGDGSITDRGSRTCRMTILSTNEPWLRWLRAQFGHLATDVALEQTGEQVTAHAADYPEFDDSGGAWEYSDIYRVSIRAHPYLSTMRERWYPDGEIRYPDDLVLTPLSAKAWYCSDGGLSWSDDTRAFAAFGTHNEAERPQFLRGLFREHGFQPNWSEPLLRFNLDETAEVLSWMGVAPAGFEYKWAYKSRERYEKLKEVNDA